MESINAVSEQRGTIDRREFSWRTVYFGFLRSRRRAVRRIDDGEVLFIDWHHPWLFFLAVGIMLMSCVDAFLTLQLLDRGMMEANPVMAAILGQGTRAFAVSKMLMTGIGILTLVFLAKAHFLNRFRAGLFLTGFFSLYACVICYEFVFLLKTL
jgi:hypothetical protein